uniref:Uncharacterized protein n=1 Tax=Candidatus Methanogaster sp. ANME-2c ERB4 TaxID=2759911 RepID=A0A7G9YQI0_9EURY|nr:hypothetical protein MIKCHCCC_00004 [Methanosarcinales archaeon ANME-2c ERB4]
MTAGSVFREHLPGQAGARVFEVGHNQRFFVDLRVLGKIHIYPSYGTVLKPLTLCIPADGTSPPIGTIGKSSEIAISLNLTAEHAENAKASETPARIGTALKLCALRGDKSLDF